MLVVRSNLPLRDGGVAWPRATSLPNVHDESLRFLLVDLPNQVIYALTFGVAVRLIAGGIQLKDDELESLVEAPDERPQSLGNNSSCIPHTT